METFGDYWNKDWIPFKLPHCIKALKALISITLNHWQHPENGKNEHAHLNAEIAITQWTPTAPRLFIALDGWCSSARRTSTLPHCSAWRTKLNVLIGRRLNEPGVLDSAASRLPQLIGSHKARRSSRLVSAVTVGDGGRWVDPMHHWHRWTICIHRSSSSSSRSRCFSLGPISGFMAWYPAVLSPPAHIQ